MSQIDDLAEKQQILPTEAIGGFPLLAILVDSAHGDVESGAVVGLVFPDGSLDEAKSNFRGFALEGHFP